MNSPRHPFPGRNVIDDTDVQMTVRAARRDPRCNGLVYCVGESAGVPHSAYTAATGTPGDDQSDLVALCSGV